MNERPCSCDSTHGAVMLALLTVRAEAGATAAEIKAHTRATVSTYVTRYIRLGRIGYIDEPTTRPRGVQFVRRYFLREHCPPGATLSEVNRQPRRLTPIASEPNGNTVKVRSHHRPVPAGDGLITAKTKRTVWEPRPDPRAIGKPAKVVNPGECRPWAIAATQRP